MLGNSLTHGAWTQYATYRRVAELNAFADQAVGARAEAIKVMVVDDHAVFAEALAMAINASGRMRCVAIANDADEAHRLVEESNPDVVVMDVGLEGEDGISATSSLRKNRPQSACWS